MGGGVVDVLSISRALHTGRGPSRRRGLRRPRPGGPAAAGRPVPRYRCQQGTGCERPRADGSSLRPGCITRAMSSLSPRVLERARSAGGIRHRMGDESGAEIGLGDAAREADARRGPPPVRRMPKVAAKPMSTSAGRPCRFGLGPQRVDQRRILRLGFLCGRLRGRGRRWVGPCRGRPWKVALQVVEPRRSGPAV